MAKRRTRSSRFPIFLIAIGLVLVTLWGTHRILYNRAMRLSDALLASYAAEPSHKADPIHITIPGIVNLPVVEAGKINGTWTVSPTSANHVHQSAVPGEQGNIIIYGHNLNKIFGYITNLMGGELVSIRMTDGTLHEYKVTETETVATTQTLWLAPTNHEVLTLYTCTGLLDSLRFVARAIPAP